jgi:hypothetical protein
MKKLIIPLLIANFAIAQQTLSVNQITGDQSVFSGIKSTTGKNLTYDEIQGSPYFDKSFHLAKLADNYEELPIRYNSYKDEIEFQKDGKTLVLPKDSKFSRVVVKSTNQTFVLLDNNNEEANGYFIELINGKNSLYKKVKTVFKDTVPAASTYASDKPATFQTQDPLYYIKTENSFIKLKNQKTINEQVPEKKEVLSTFFKSNKIKFDKDADLMKLVNFLNQN